MAIRDLDLLWSVEGDFVLATDGDLALTEYMQSRGLTQKILSRLMSAPGDWAMTPETGVAWDAIMGQPNNRETGRIVEEMVTSELLRGGLLSASEFSVTVFPSGERQLGILLAVSPTGVRGETTLTFTYDMRDNRMIPRIM